MSNTSIIENFKGDNALYNVDSIIKVVMNSKYPDDTSVIGDTLRFSLETIYGINLSLFDTHIFDLCTGSNGYLMPLNRKYYIYEGKYEDIQKLPKDLLEEWRFPEGYLLGFFPTEFKDQSFRNENVEKYLEFLYNICSAMIEDRCEEFPYLFDLYAACSFAMYRGFNDITNTDRLIYQPFKTYSEYINSHKKEFITAYQKFNYANLTKFHYDYHMAVMNQPVELNVYQPDKIMSFSINGKTFVPVDKDIPNESDGDSRLKETAEFLKKKAAMEKEASKKKEE